MYRWLDHTAEIELRIEAESEPRIFAEALTAIAELIGEELAGEPEQRDLELQAADGATLLAEWLQELVFLAEAEDFVAERVLELDLVDGLQLRAAVRGRRGRPRHLVKAVTYHGLSLERTESGWRASVVLDV